MTGFWEEMKRLGKEPNPYQAGFLQTVGVAETREEAYKLYREPAEYFYGRCLHIDARFANPPGYTSEATLRSGVQGMVSRAADASAPRKAPSKSTRCRGRRPGSSTSARAFAARPTASAHRCPE